MVRINEEPKSVSQLDLIEAKLLQIDQKIEELKASVQTLIDLK